MKITIDILPIAKTMIKDLKIKNMDRVPQGWSDYILDYLTEKYDLEGKLRRTIEEVIRSQA